MEASEGRRGIERWAGLGAILYVVLFIVGVIVAFGGAPETDDPPAKYISYFSDSGHRDKVGVGWIIVVLGVFFFLWFLSALRQVVKPIDGDGFLTTLVTVGGAVYAALGLAAISVWMANATAADDSFHHQVYPANIVAANDTWYVLHVAGAIGAGTMMIAASLAALRAALVPRWAGITGIVFGVLALGAIAFFPNILIAIWLLVAGVLVARAPARPLAAPPPAL